MFRKLAILGPGLLGGSLLKAARACDLAQSTAAWARRPEAVRQVLDMGLADLASTDLAQVAQDADLVVLCTPVESFREIGAMLTTMLPSDAIVTDVGSVKGSVVHDMKDVLGANFPRFIGSHPMAGSEQAGIEAAREDLFQGAACVITPVETTSPDAIAVASKLWTSVGATLHSMPPLQHDEMVAAISHVPHIIASALVHLAAESHPKAFECIGNGFRDTTRVASGSPILWRHIIASNQAAIIDELDTLIRLLERVRVATAAKDWATIEDFLGKASQTREYFRTTLYKH